MASDPSVCFSFALQSNAERKTCSLLRGLVAVQAPVPTYYYLALADERHTTVGWCLSPSSALA